MSSSTRLLNSFIRFSFPHYCVLSPFAPTFSYFSFNYYSITCILSMGSSVSVVELFLLAYDKCVCARLNVSFVCMSSAHFSLSIHPCFALFFQVFVKQFNFLQHIMIKNTFNAMYIVHCTVFVFFFRSLCLLFLSIYFT